MVKVLKTNDSGPKDVYAAPEPPIGKITKFGVIIILIFFGGFGSWAVLTPLESAAIAPGKVTVDSNRKTIQHLEGGLIKKIYIRDGSIVKKGDLLISLDETIAKATFDLVSGQVNELLTREARLMAERDRLDKVIYPQRVLESQSDPRVLKTINTQNSIFENNKRTLKGQIEILNKQIDQIKKEIESHEAQVTAADDQQKLIQEEIDAMEELKQKQQYVDRPKLLQLKRESARLTGDKGESFALVTRAHQKVSEIQSQISSLYDTNQQDTLKELSDVKQRLSDALEKEKSAADVLQRMDIKAPQGGKVVGLLKHTVGGVIQPGEAVLEIVPTEDLLVIEARVNPIDIDIVHQGLKAIVQLTAFKQRNMPTLTGTVTNVSADSFQDEHSGESYFKARIVISQEELDRVKEIELYPGMPAQAMIIVDNRTPFEYFMTPIKESFERAFREQ